MCFSAFWLRSSAVCVFISLMTLIYKIKYGVHICVCYIALNSTHHVELDSTSSVGEMIMYFLSSSCKLSLLGLNDSSSIEF